MIQFAGRMIRAGTYVVLVATVVVGIPWASIRYVGWPLPTSVPDGATVQDWIEDPFTPTRFWAVMSVIGWLLWAALVFFIIMEVLARLGRIRLPRIRLATPVQGLAAGVVGATATALTAPAAHASPPTVAVAPAADPDVLAATLPRSPDLPVYVVEHGDWLSAIAARLLGDQDAYPRIQALNPELEARDARFPNHIERGWKVRLPVDAHDRGIRMHAAGRLHQTTTATAPPIEEDPSAPAPTTSGTDPETATPPAHEQPTTHDADADVDGDGGGHPDVIVGPSTVGAMTGAGLVASLLFAMLTAERRRLRGLYAAGRRLLSANGRVERELRIAQQPADVERLDAALRSLGHGLAGRATRPDIVGVRLVGGDVQVLLGEPDDAPPAPWLDEGTQWALPAYLEPSVKGNPASPLPMLVTIGSRAGRHLLVDLERLATLTIGGHPDGARDLLRHIACELACNTWSDHATVHLAGLGDEADALAEIGRDRITIAELPNAAIATLRAEAAHRATTVAAAPPTILIVADPDAATRAELADLHQRLTDVGGCGIAIVTTVPDGSPIGPAMLTVTDTGHLKAELPGLRLTTAAAAVPADMLEPLAAVLRAYRLESTPPTGDLPPWDDAIDPTQGALDLFDPAVPDTARTPDVAHVWAASTRRDSLDEDLAAWHDGAATPPRVGILGPIEVRMPGMLNDSRHRLYTEMLIYLLTRPSLSADRATIEDALWYGNPAGETTVRKVMYKLRQWLGQRPDGSEWIPDRDADGIYRVEHGVLLDWHLLLRLQQRGIARGADGLSDLRAALQLVRGVPMRDLRDNGPYRRPYTWISDSDIAPGRLLATIADLAHRVAEQHLAISDTATARWAIDQAWLADPHRGFDDLWHDRMRLEYDDGQHAALEQIVKDYVAAQDAEVPEDLPTPIYNRIRALLPAA